MPSPSQMCVKPHLACCHCLQLSNEGFFPRHQRLWRGLRNLLTGSSVPLRAAQLSRLMQDELQAAWPAGQEVRVALCHSV